MAPISKKRPSIQQTLRKREALLKKPYSTLTFSEKMLVTGAVETFPVAYPGRDVPLTRKDQREREWQRIKNESRNDRITKPSQQKKRRRPGKKMIAVEDMNEMIDALPDVSDASEDDEWEGFSEGEVVTQTAGRKRRRKAKVAEGKIQMRSLQHRPGAMKRKRKMEGVEIERFGRNLAQLSGNIKVSSTDAQGGGGQGLPDAASEDQGGGASSKEKWAALRAFIGSTMEQNEGFKKS